MKLFLRFSDQPAHNIFRYQPLNGLDRNEPNEPQQKPWESSGRPFAKCSLDQRFLCAIASDVTLTGKRGGMFCEAVVFSARLLPRDAGQP